MLALRNPNDPRNVKEVIDNLVKQFDNTASFNLANDVTTTTVINPKVNSFTKVFLEPRTFAAAQDRAQTYVSGISNGSFVVTHPSASTLRTFDYVIHGV